MPTMQNDHSGDPIATAMTAFGQTIEALYLSGAHPEAILCALGIWSHRIKVLVTKEILDEYKRVDQGLGEDVKANDAASLQLDRVMQQIFKDCAR